MSAGPRSLKFLFWNIQNVYEYKTVTPMELELESQITGDPRLNFAKTVKRSKRIFEQRAINHREFVCETIATLDPDLVVIVEFSVGKQDLVAKGLIDHELVVANHFGILQFMVSLNARSSAGRPPWAAAQSPVNATDLLFEAEEDGNIAGVRHKNSMFELYGVLWRTDKLRIHGAHGPLPEGEIPVIKPLTTARDGTPLHFKERTPGWAAFSDVNDPRRELLLVVNHSVFGKKLEARRRAIHEIARSDVVQHAANTNTPVVVGGDFNLNFETEQAAFAPLIAEPPHGWNMGTRIGDRKTARVYKRAADLKNAYDQIFTRQFANDGDAGDVFNFAEVSFNNDYDLARRISDHLPVTAELQAH